MSTAAFKFQTQRIKYSLAVFCLALLYACGAPLKKADKVQKIFNDSEQLDGKVSSLCQVLSTRPQAPNLQNFAIAADVCKEPARRALNYKSLGPDDPVQFSLVRADGDLQSSQNGGVSDAGKFFSIQTRSEIWLNRSLLQIAQVLFKGLDQKSNTLAQTGGKSTQSTFDFEIIGKPQFDAKTFEFRLEFGLKSTRQQNGQIDIDNRFLGQGKMLDKKYFAITAETTEDSAVEKSILNRGKIVIFVIPHAGDIYLELATDLRFHDFGVGDVMKDQITKALGPGLKKVPDLIANIESSK